jgi:hypothetical protein
MASGNVFLNINQSITSCCFLVVEHGWAQEAWKKHTRLKFRTRGRPSIRARYLCYNLYSILLGHAQCLAKATFHLLDCADAAFRLANGRSQFAESVKIELYIPTIALVLFVD